MSGFDFSSINSGVNDYSFLFSQSGKSSGGSSSFISDYASIRNGSYKKLLKAYYAKTKAQGADGTDSSNSTSKDAANTIAKIQSDSDSLQKSVDKLLAKGKDSLFVKKDITTKNEDGTTTTTKDYDRDAIYKSVKEFADNYNAMLDSAGKSNSTPILKNALSMVSLTKANKDMLSKVGITIGKDNKLSVNEDTVKKADIIDLKSLFNESGAYGYDVGSKASKINYNAFVESTKANTYNIKGAYDSAYSAGKIFDSLF